MQTDDKLLLVAKMIVNDMDAIAEMRVDVPVYFGMGQALNRVYCVLRGIPMREIPKLVPREMMEWVRIQPLAGISNQRLNDNKVLLKLSEGE